MRTRFYNARVLTMKDFDIFLGEVWVEDNKIIYVGKVKDQCHLVKNGQTV